MMMRLVFFSGSDWWRTSCVSRVFIASTARWANFSKRLKSKKTLNDRRSVWPGIQKTRRIIDGASEVRLHGIREEHNTANSLTRKASNFSLPIPIQIGRIIEGPLSGMSVVGFRGALTTHERECKFAMPVTVASRGRDWQQWHVKNKIRLRRYPLAMTMFTIDGQ